MVPVQLLNTFFFLSCRLVSPDVGHTTPAPRRFSQFRWKLFFIGGPCLFLGVIFFVLTGNDQTKKVKQGNIEKYALSVSPTCLNNSGEWIEVGIGVSEPLQHDARVCRKFPTVELLKCCCYPNPNANPNPNPSLNPNPNPNPNSYCNYYC